MIYLVINVLKFSLHSWRKTKVFDTCAVLWKQGLTFEKCDERTEWMSQGEGYQGVGAGDVLLLHLSFWLERFE